MHKFQLFIVFIICSMVMVILQNGLNETWDWSKISNFALAPKSVNINELDDDVNLLRIKSLLSNRTDKFKIYLNTEDYNVFRRFGDEARLRPLAMRKHKGSKHSYHRLSSIDMLMKVIATRDHRRNSSRWLNKYERRTLLRSFNPLASFPVINGTSSSPIRYILLVSHFRGGSSFVGDLLQQNWKTYYSFEPLHLLQINYKVQSDLEKPSLSLLSNIYSCSFTAEPAYVDWIRKRENQFLLTWNRFLWSMCNIQRSWCYDPIFMNQLCLRSMYRIIKVTRLSLESTEKLLNTLPDTIDLKVVYLVRDPRAVHNSRSKLEWCTKTPCGDYNLMCDDYATDLVAYRRLVDTFGDKILALRHEDLSIDPSGKAEALFKALNLPFTQGVRRFLRINTEAELPVNHTIDPYSIRRSSKKVITQWTKDLNISLINEIQLKCSNVLQQLGYKMIDLSSPQITSLDEIAFEDILEEKLPLPNAL